MIKKVSKEIEHGKKISKNAEDIWGWSTKAGKYRAERRADFFVQLGGITDKSEILELGCGTGLFSKKVYDKTKAKITAIDISEDLLEQAIKKVPHIDFKIEDAMNLSFKANSFDCVYGSSVLHHLNLDEALKEIRRVLKPNGKMVFAEPNMINPQIFLQKNIPALKRMMGDSPDETAIVRWSFAKLMKKTGFVNVKIFPYDFLHPATPSPFIPLIKKAGEIAEKTPLLKEIAGSVVIYGEKSI